MKKNNLLILVLGLIVLMVLVWLVINKKNESKEINQVKNIETEKIVDSKDTPKTEAGLSEDMKNCNGKHLSFKYPKSWGDCQEYSSGFIFRTDYPNYKVDLNLFITQITKTKFNEMRGLHMNLLELTRGSGEVYDYPQGGSLMAGNIKLDENYYNFVFNVESNQVSPDEHSFWRPDNNIKNEALLEIIKSIKSINNSVTAQERCGSEPVLISKLKVGDFYNTHKIKEISGSFLENNCEISCPEPNSGNILFDGEEKVSGVLVRNDGYFGLVSFVPDDKNWVPGFSFKSGTEDDNLVLEGLSCLKGLALDIESVSNDAFDLPALSKLPGIKEFLNNSKDGDEYPEKVFITINGLQTGFTFGGESGTWAKLVDAEVFSKTYSN